MPQDKFITRKKAGVFEMLEDVTDTRKSRQVLNMTEQKLKDKAYNDLMKAKSVPAAKRDPFAVGRAETALKRAQSGNDADARALRSASDTVARRDATNARIARGRLAERASSAKTQPRGGRMTSNMAAMGPIAGAVAAADALYAADEATGFRRTKYSGPSGGPSFSMNPYASSNKSAYAGQSAMSKAMGVGKKK